ncbi:MAG TPA: hypothetical protein VFD64_05290 [Gemmatimonadaceae bacterium]|nr:hypothetical protein [Gemmatimonadaceae bacterium]
MRRYLLIVPLLVACGGSETPPADSAAAAAPPMLTEADVAGTWAGNFMAEGSDSVIATWTDMCSGGTCRLVVSAAPNDTVVSTYTIAGDSLMYSMAAYKDPMAGGAMVTDAGVARISGNQITGNGMIRLADRPDSVVMRYRFTGTKQP